jgi:hypothetical protein
MVARALAMFALAAALGCEALPTEAKAPEGETPARDDRRESLREKRHSVGAAGSLEPDAPHRVGWVEFEPEWKSTSFGAYLLPKQDFADETGAVDVIFQFHDYRQAEKQWRAVGINAIVVGCAFGVGNKIYSDAFVKPERFGNMLDEVLGAVRAAKNLPSLHPRRIGLVSFSAGYGATGRILAQQHYFDMVDAVVVVDGLHTDYTHEHKPDIKALQPFIRFAGEAAAKKKLMVMTHSSIYPGDYASSSESIAAILEILAISRVDANANQKNDRGMHQLYEANAGDLYVRGYAGKDPQDHTDQLQAIDELLDDFVVPRWAKPGE